MVAKKNIPYTETIAFAAELVTKAFNEIARNIVLKDQKLNKEEYIILENIYLNPGIIQLEIAKNILMKRSYVCKFLAELEEKGFIRREPALRGKSQIVYKNYITPLGEKTYKDVIKHICIFQNKYMQDYAEFDFNNLSQIAFKLTDKLKKDFNLKF